MQNSPSVKISNKLIPVLVVLIGLKEFFYPYKGWFMLLVGFGGAWLLAYFWAQDLAKNLSITRKSNTTWAQIGDKINEHFILQNNSWASALWVTIEDQSNIPDYHAHIGRYLRRKSTMRWRTGSLCTTRGLYLLGPTYLHTTDPFGIYQITIPKPDASAMLVIPPIVPLPSIQVADGERIVAGQTRTSTTERTVSAAAVREYTYGDDIQSIHWPTSARKNNLHVRIYDNTPSSEWWILLDLDQDNIFGPGQNNTLEHSVILAASLADRGLKNGRSVGLTAYGQTEAMLPPKAGNSQHWEILRALAVAQPGKYKFNQVLNQALPLMNKNTSAILITSSNNEEWVERLPIMSNREISLTILHLDQVSFSGSQNPEHILNKLSDLNILHHRITSDLIQVPEFEEADFF